jgi:hypothetical protein
MYSVYGFFGGRSMTAFWALFIVGAALAFSGHLTSAFVALAGTLHGFVIARAISEDKFCNGKTPASDDPHSFDKTELKGERSSP